MTQTACVQFKATTASDTLYPLLRPFPKDLEGEAQNLRVKQIKVDKLWRCINPIFSTVEARLQWHGHMLRLLTSLVPADDLVSSVIGRSLHSGLPNRRPGRGISLLTPFIPPARTVFACYNEQVLRSPRV